jgi:hypothetical protein
MHSRSKRARTILVQRGHRSSFRGWQHHRADGECRKLPFGPLNAMKQYGLLASAMLLVLSSCVLTGSYLDEIATDAQIAIGAGLLSSSGMQCNLSVDRLSDMHTTTPKGERPARWRRGLDAGPVRAAPHQAAVGRARYAKARADPERSGRPPRPLGRRRDPPTPSSGECHPTR